VVIEDGLEIDLLTDDEIEACADLGVLQPFPPGMPVFKAADCVGARVTVPMPALSSPPGTELDLVKQVTDATANPRRFGERSPFRFGELADDVLFVLRLARPDFIASGGVVCMRTNLLGRATSWQRRRDTRHLAPSEYALDDATAATVRDLWSKMQQMGATKKTKLPPIAARRFNAAIDRISLEDSIVDHVIAAEALLLKDAGSPEDRTELGYRLSLRAAVFLEDVGRERRPTFKLMKSAYDLRSGIAHGAEAPAEVRVAGRTVPLPEFVDELGNLMRDVLRKAVDEVAASRGFGTADYWDDLILGPGRSSTEAE
jgi:hypothetical protein